MRNRWIAALAPLALALACDSGPQAPEPQEPSAAVVTATVELGPIAETLETFGTAELDPEQTRTVTLVRAGEIWNVAVVPGLQVQKGDPLLTLGPMPSTSPQVQAATTDLKFAETALARVRSLGELHLATNQDIQQAEKTVQDARTALRALRGSSGVGETISAPEDGIVSQVRVQKGSVVQAGNVAVVLAPANAMAVRTGFEVEDVPRLSVGLEVRLDSVYGSSEEKTATARLAQLHRMADTATQLVEALILVPNPPGWMVAGQRVRVRVILAAAEDAVQVPREALLERGGETGVFVVRSGHAHWQPVRVGIRAADQVQALEGLAAGDVVVTTGRTAVQDGIAVRSAARPPGAS